jgi:serpin B
MQKLLPRFTAIVAAVLLAGCGGSDSPPEAPQAAFDIARSDIGRAPAMAVAGDDLAALIAGNTDFAFSLYRELAADDGNLFFSPHSISVALAMVSAGARGETRAEIAEALSFRLEEPALHEAFNALDLALASRGEGAMGRDGEPFRLRVVNAAWAQRGYPFLTPYLDTLARYYGAGLNLLDFAAEAEPSRRLINDWVAGETEQRIPEMLPAGTINSLTRLVLTNAVYFNAAWASPFRRGATTPEPFTLLDGTVIEVPTMAQDGMFRHARVDGLTALELDYDGREVAILLLMGDADFQGFEAALSPDLLDRVLEALSPAGVVLRLPRFESRTSAALTPVLRNLGMHDAFLPGLADLSGIDGQRDLYLTDVLHEAFVLLDEEGTEAAAATAAIIAPTSAPPDVVVRFDRPFVFAIRDVESGAVLFMGRVLDPRG